MVGARTEPSVQCQACGAMFPRSTMEEWTEEGVQCWVCKDINACRSRVITGPPQPAVTGGKKPLSLVDVVPHEQLRTKFDAGTAAGTAAHLRDMVDRWDMEDPDRPVFQRELRYMEETLRAAGGRPQSNDGHVPAYVHAILDAYLKGEALDFKGQPVPDLVRMRLEQAFVDGRLHKSGQTYVHSPLTYLDGSRPGDAMDDTSRIRRLEGRMHNAEVRLAKLEGHAPKPPPTDTAWLQGSARPLTEVERMGRWPNVRPADPSPRMEP